MAWLEGEALVPEVNLRHVAEHRRGVGRVAGGDDGVRGGAVVVIIRLCPHRNVVGGAGRKPVLKRKGERRAAAGIDKAFGALYRRGEVVVL